MRRTTACWSLSTAARSPSVSGISTSIRCAELAEIFIVSRATIYRALDRVHAQAA